MTVGKGLAGEARILKKRILTWRSSFLLRHETWLSLNWGCSEMAILVVVLAQLWVPIRRECSSILQQLFWRLSGVSTPPMIQQHRTILCISNFRKLASDLEPIFAVEYNKFEIDLWSFSCCNDFDFRLELESSLKRIGATWNTTLETRWSAKIRYSASRSNSLYSLIDLKCS